MAAGKALRQKIKNDQTKLWLEEVLHEYSRKDFIFSDPLFVVHQFAGKADQELVALVTALFSFGNVKSIINTVQEILKPLGDNPKKSLLEMSPKEIEKIWKSAYYRFYKSEDIQFLFRRLKELLHQYDSLESAFIQNPEQCMLANISKFRDLFLAGKPQSNGLRFMFADPHSGTAKRWHMFLRWVVRKDDVDLGLWLRVSKATLIQPLDTHLFQIGRSLGLTRRNSAGLLAALEMTERFRAWSPEDPIKYDFALCRLGILKQRDLRLRSYRRLLKAAKF
jgi:uncharacterized protein (TIGR02757 family)